MSHLHADHLGEVTLRGGTVTSPPPRIRGKTTKSQKKTTLRTAKVPKIGSLLIVIVITKKCKMFLTSPPWPGTRRTA